MGHVLFTAAALCPFAVLAWRDNLLHLRARKTPHAEQALHALLGIVLAVMVYGAFADETKFVASLAVLAPLGALDEFYFHREIPPVEVDVHAKQHWALLIFVVAVLVRDRWF